MSRARITAALLLAAAALTGGAVAAPAAVPPLADFFRMPLFAAPRLSPDGRYLAAIVNQKGDAQDLAVLDVENPKNSKIIASLVEADIYDVHWVNDARLVFTARDRISGEGRPVAPGLWAIDRDGANLKQWISASRYAGDKRKPREARLLEWQWHLLRTLGDGSDDVIVEQSIHDQATGRVVDTQLARLNTRTGGRQRLAEDAPEGVLQWLVDERGEPRFATTYDAKTSYVTYRRLPADGDKPARWENWDSGETERAARRMPLWIGADSSLLVLRRVGGDTLALFEDGAKEPLLGIPGHDLTPRLVFDRPGGRLLGAHHEGEGPGSTWFDGGMRAAQQQVDALLPNTVNVIDCGRCLDASASLLVTTLSDQAPPAYHLYRRDAGTLSVLARAAPWINPEQMGQRFVRRIAARDGRAMPVQLTVPPGPATGPRPAVVLVHGGPWVRGNYWPWERHAQLLASRGYLVIEPEFRGSRGYGTQHYRAGFKQWGLNMQDDVADALQWAVKEGLADPARACIAGASYGGYAALMGLVRHGDRYQCAINWVGVSDIDLLFSRHWGDTGDATSRVRMNVAIGDREADAALLRANSPLHNADKIKRPLLMAYGALDQRVPIKHGEDMRDALAKLGAEVEWISYADEGHGWRKPANNVDFWARVEKFLDRHIGAGRMATAGAQ